MGSNEIRNGLLVTVDGREGRIFRVYVDGADVEFADGTSELGVNVGRIRIPLHEGVFTSDETLERWRATAGERAGWMAELRDLARAAERKRLAAIGGKAFDVAEFFGLGLPPAIRKALAAANLYAPFLKYVPTGQNDLAKEIVDFVTEVIALLATFFGVTNAEG